MEKINFKIIKNFGPSVFKIKIPEKIVNTLNNHIDEIINDQSKSKDLDMPSQDKMQATNILAPSVEASQ